MSANRRCAVHRVGYGLCPEMSTAQSADGTPEDAHHRGMPSGDAQAEGDPSTERAEARASLQGPQIAQLDE